MGNCCGTTSANEYTKQNVNTLIKIQSAYRTHLAKKQLNEVRDQKLKTLFGANEDSSVSVGETESSRVADQLRAGQRNDKIQPFRLAVEDIELNDGVARVYIDEFKSIGDGKLYKGQWNKKTGLKDGVGVQLWKDGSKYEGMWSNDLCNGRGRMTHANGDIYEGAWKNDKANGYGVFVDVNNAQYEGEWSNDLQHGHGVETWEDGASKYTGLFYKGKKNGKGKFEWEDGSFYEGDFVDGSFQGFGKYYFADLDKWYEGEFRMSNMEGRGTESWSDGRKYDGDFKNGKKDGQGTFQWPNGNKYIGTWKNGKQNGVGIHYEKEDGSKKQGEWENGIRKRWISANEMLAAPISPSKLSSPSKRAK